MSTKIKLPKEYRLAEEFLEKLTGGPLTFGDMITALRQCDETTQVELAHKVKISRAYLCDIEKKRKSVHSALAAKLAKAMRYSVEHFVAVALRDQLKKAGLHFRAHLEAA